MKLKHNQGFFSTKTPHGAAEICYRIKDNVMYIYFTHVLEQDIKKGIAENLTKAAFDFARGNDYRVEPECPYTQAFVEKHEEYKKYTERNTKKEKHPMHPTTVANYSGSLEDLAQDIANMRYDAVCEFFGYLAKKIDGDAKADQKRGKTQLAVKLGNIAHLVNEAKEEMDAAWKICRPHMKKE